MATPQSNPSTAAEQPIVTVRTKGLILGDPSTTDGKHTITVFSAFGTMMTNPEAINELRQDVRSWFMAYIPVWENSFSQNDLEESMSHYEVLDHFLTALVDANISRMRGEDLATPHQ